MYAPRVEKDGDGRKKDTDAQPPDSGSKIPAAAPGTKKTSTDAVTDGYFDKLVKYVPAEVIAFFAPLASIVEKQTALLVATGIVGLVATPLYIKRYSSNPKNIKNGAQPPPIYNYVLSSVAFLVWALATSKLGDLLHMTSTDIAFMLGVTVFLIPLVDKTITDRKAKSKRAN
jgi:hypothetical protein